MVELKNKRTLVLGMGKTGMSAVRFLLQQGAVVLAADQKPAVQWENSLRAIAGADAKIEVCPYESSVLSQTDLVVPSPGVAPTNFLLAAANEMNIPVISEVELAGRYLQTPMIAVTGTNGKTTTTTLIGEILRGAGRKVFVGGNIGNPLIEYVTGDQDADYAVVEISSFQLQWAEKFHPFVALLMNVTSDHIDYHGDFGSYRNIKERIFGNQTVQDLAILNAEDAATADLSRRLKSRVCRFSATERLEVGIFIDGGQIVYDCAENSAPETYPIAMVKIPGQHNLHNVMAAIAAAKACGCTAAEIVRSVENFHGIAHRIEYAGEKRGVVFYDDSKGTNVGAVEVAIDTFTKPLILLMGGRDKDIDFSVLIPRLKAKVKELIIFGEARDKIYRAIGDVVATTRSETLRAAVETAYGHASPGDAVLLSPGCASFDEFKDYKERGRFFKETVRNLQE